MAKNDDTRELDRIRRATRPEDDFSRKRFSHPATKQISKTANGSMPKKRR